MSDFTDTAAEAALSMEAAAGLSTRWEVLKKHEGVYTDSAAKVVVSPRTGDFLATWCAGDVALLHLSSGSMLGKIHAGSDDVEDQFSSFDIDPSEQYLATIARKSMQIKIHQLAPDTEAQAATPASSSSPSSLRPLIGTEISSWKCTHTLPVLDLAWSPTGGELASCSADKSILVYSVSRKVVTHRFVASAGKPGHKSRVVKIIWHPNPGRAELISCAEDGEMRIWRLKDHSSTLLANHMALVTSVSFTADGNTLVSGGRDKIVNVWSIDPNAKGAAYGKHVRTVPVYESVEGICVLPGRPACVPAQPKSSSSSSSSSSSTSNTDFYFTTGGSKGLLRTWHSSDMECVYTKTLPTAAVTASTQGTNKSEKYIANQVAHLMMVPNGKKTTAKGVKAEQQSDDDSSIIAVTMEQNFYIYSTSTFHRKQLLIGYNDELIDIKCHPDNRHALVASNSSQIRCVNMETLATSLISGHEDIVLALDVSPCGKYVVTSSKDFTVRFWKLDLEPSAVGQEKEEVAKCIAIGEGHTESVGCVTFTKNKHTGKLYAVSGARERIVKLWDCNSFSKLNETSEPIRLTAITSRLAHDKDINCLEYSPNDKLVASGSEDKTVRIWDAADLTPKGVMRGHKRGVWCVRFSPVDKVLATASGDKSIKLWSMEDYTCLKTLESHTASVKQVVFINSGMQLLSCGDDAVLKLWTIKTSECVGTFADAHDSKIWACAVTQDGRRVLTGGSDSVLNIWHDVTKQDIEEVEQQKESFLLKEQDVRNLIAQKNYGRAVELCLQMEQPRRIYTIVQDLMVTEEKEKLKRKQQEGGEEQDNSTALVQSSSSASSAINTAISRIVSSLDDDNLGKLILYIRDWNTHAKTSQVAQMLLSHLLRVLPPSRLLSSRPFFHQSTSLQLYSDRHFLRLDKLLTKSYIIDYMLNAMNQVEGKEESVKRKEVAASETQRVVQVLLGDQDDSTANPATTLKSSSASSTAMAADEDGFDDDDDGSAWATNWKNDAKEDEAMQESGEDEPEQEQKNQTKANSTKNHHKAAVVVPSADSKKRKQPAASSSSSTPSEVTQSKKQKGNGAAARK